MTYHSPIQDSAIVHTIHTHEVPLTVISTCFRSTEHSDDSIFEAMCAIDAQQESRSLREIRPSSHHMSAECDNTEHNNDSEIQHTVFVTLLSKPLAKR